MPCRCDYPEERYEDTSLRKEADKATRAACDMRTIIRRHNPDLLEELTVETRKWIAQHDKEDAERIAREEAEGLRQKVKKDAKAKLRRALKSFTLEERRVLGL